ncbi:MAG TPA: hypothetical protein VKC60_18315, partial [Opitutaceae bacterium]|nr:hypothetical protein [Opitutaceae bacterium]
MKLPNFTIGRKITSGYTLVLALFAVVTIIAYLALGRVGRGMSQYSAGTAEANAATNLETAMYALCLRANQFLATGASSDVDRYTAARKDLDASQTAAAKEITEPTRAKDISDARKLLAEYDQDFLKIVDLANQKADIIAKTIDPRIAEITDGLKNMLTAARASGDQTASYKTSAGLQNF